MLAEAGVTARSWSSTSPACRRQERGPCYGWPGTSDAATFSYDGAKRPTQYAETASGSALATLSRGYDRLGSVNSETQTLAGVSGYAGGTAQTLTYDQLGRVTGSTLGTITRAYTYDPDSNRLSANESGTTTTYTYDRTDQLTTQQVGAGTVRSATYDAYGNLTSEPNPDGTATFTTYTNNLNDVLTGQTPASGSGAVTYTIDALGRHRTQVAGGVTNTYSYAGSSPTVVQIANATTTTNSAIDALGSRLATKTSAGGFGWLVPDLHGDIAAAVNAGGSTITDAFRYDPYGKVVASATSSLPTPWRYQGRLLESSGSDPALYDFGFRSYDTGLGAFTSLDDVAGSAMNPVTFNRFLYASANPETLSDPSGHTVILVDDAYGTTITTDATHKHVVHHQTTAARIKAWKALDWKKIYAARKIERTTQLAADKATRDARDAAAARVAMKGISDRMGDNGPASLDGMDVNGNPVSMMCKNEADVATCDIGVTIPPRDPVSLHDALRTTSDVTGVAAFGFAGASLLGAVTGPGDIPIAGIAGSLEFVSVASGGAATYMDCSSHHYADCLTGLANLGLGASGLSAFTAGRTSLMGEDTSKAVDFALQMGVQGFTLKDALEYLFGPPQ